MNTLLRYVTQQRNAWRNVALEQAQTIKVLRALLDQPRPAHVYRDEAVTAAMHAAWLKAGGKLP